MCVRECRREKEKAKETNKEAEVEEKDEHKHKYKYNQRGIVQMLVLRFSDVVGDKAND